MRKRILERILALALVKMAEAVRTGGQERFRDPRIREEVMSLYRKAWVTVRGYDPTTIARVPTPSKIQDLLENKQVEVPTVWEEALEGIDLDWTDDR